MQVDIIKSRLPVRTMADAIHALRDEASPNWSGIIYVGEFRLPPRKTTNIIVLIQSTPEFHIRKAIGFPFSANYWARSADAIVKTKRKAEDLAWAEVKSDGSVQLLDGTQLTDVSIIPTLYHPELTPLEREALALTLELMGNPVARYRDLPGLVAPKLSFIKKTFDERREKDPSISPISQETIRTALDKCGIRAGVCKGPRIKRNPRS